MVWLVLLLSGAAHGGYCMDAMAMLRAGVPSPDVIGAMDAGEWRFKAKGVACLREHGAPPEVVSAAAARMQTAADRRASRAAATGEFLATVGAVTVAAVETLDAVKEAERNAVPESISGGSWEMRHHFMGYQTARRLSVDRVGNLSGKVVFIGGRGGAVGACEYRGRASESGGTYTESISTKSVRIRNPNGDAGAIRALRTYCGHLTPIALKGPATPIAGGFEVGSYRLAPWSPR